MSVDPSTWSPRERARHHAARGTIDLVRVLAVAGLALALAVVLDVAAAPEAPAPWLATLAMALRAALGGALAFVTLPLRRWASSLGLGPWLTLAGLLALASALLGLAALVGLGPPDAVPPALWPPLLATTGHVAFAGALMLLLQVLARFAAKEELAGTARTLARSSLAVVGALVAGAAVVDPALLPAWWVGPAVAVAALWALAALHVIPWDKALWPTLFGGSVGVLLVVMQAPLPLVTGLGALIGLATAAIAPRHGLAEVAAVLAEEPSAAPSRTFIRRLLDGPDASQVGSRLGAHPASSNPDDSLALAYRELGIDPPKPSTRPVLHLVPPVAPAPPTAPPTAPTAPTAPAPAAPTPAAPAADLPPLPTIAKLEPVANPRSRAALRPAPDPTRPDPTELGAWGQAALGLHHYFLGFIGRVALLVAGYMLAQGPIGKNPWVQRVELAALAAAGAFQVLGLLRLQRMPARAAARRPARVAVALTLVNVLCDLAVLASVDLAPTAVALALLVADAALFVAATAALLVALRRLLGDLGAGPARSKALAAGVQLGIYAAFATFAAVIGSSPDSELAWLSIPAGLATAVLGLSFFVSMLWLLTDARSSIVDWQVRVRRAHDPDRREDGDPDPAA